MLLSCTKEAISVEVVGNISGRSSKFLVVSVAGSSPESPSQQQNVTVLTPCQEWDGYTQAFHSPTSDALLRRKCRCVGKAGAAGCSVGPPGWAGRDARLGSVCTAERSSSA